MYALRQCPFLDVVSAGRRLMSCRHPSYQTWIERLQDLEKNSLHHLLQDKSIWKSLDIIYHPPHVERLWCQLGDHRLYLHFVYPCDRDHCLFHPHPWPSVIHILEGEYEMGMGFSSDITAPDIFATILSQGSTYYEMTHPDGWHYVRPCTRVTSSVMLTGPPWDRPLPAPEGAQRNPPLSEERVLAMLHYFKRKFPR